MKYSIFDPAGNITALVEGDVLPEKRPLIASQIMKSHPEVEQVGFVQFANSDKRGFNAELNMAGGEFCGNASMCTAALYAMRHPAKPDCRQIDVKLRVSGMAQPVISHLYRKTDQHFLASIQLPSYLSIQNKYFSFEQYQGNIPVVELEGISHCIISPESGFWTLLSEKDTAEQAIKLWCDQLKSSGLGLIFVQKRSCGPLLLQTVNSLSGFGLIDAPQGHLDCYKMIPLVYIPKSQTIFWENSCASGSCSVGMYLAEKTGADSCILLDEPGGHHISVNLPKLKKNVLIVEIKLLGEYHLGI